MPPAFIWGYLKIIMKKDANLIRDLRLNFLQRHKDSNLEMTESESVALPFGDGASNNEHMLQYLKENVNNFFMKIKDF